LRLVFQESARAVGSVPTSTSSTNSVPPKDRQIAEHSSNLLSWTRAAGQAGAKVRVVDVDDEGRPRLEQFKALLSKRTRIVAFTDVSNVLGDINPAKEMCALAREVGARVVIDGAQALRTSR
jgi:cysteine desulfurase/selenocysteine lyase